MLSHWLPFLLFSVAAGALAERFDPRRIIQIGMVMFMLVSIGWGVLFVTDTLEIWSAMALLAIHGCAGVLWHTPNQIILYELVGPADLPSAVRLNATARYLGVLVGPAAGGVIMILLGPAHGILLNVVFYLPMVLWLINAPCGPAAPVKGPRPQRAVRGFADIIQTFRNIRGYPVLVSMIALGGATSFIVGNAYHAQMPAFALDLGQGDPGVAYSLLLAADALGAIAAGFALEYWRLLRSTPRMAILLAVLWATALLGFAAIKVYPVALALLFVAGFFELSFNAMAQTLVQLNAPAGIRGQVIGLFNMASLGMRAFSGITVGVLGAAIGVHWSLGLCALVTIGVMGLLYRST